MFGLVTPVISNLDANHKEKLIKKTTDVEGNLIANFVSINLP
jgi:hypothetical protein